MAQKKASQGIGSIVFVMIVKCHPRTPPPPPPPGE